MNLTALGPTVGATDWYSSTRWGQECATAVPGLSQRVSCAQNRAQGVLAPGLPGAMLASGADTASPLYRAVVRIQSRYRGYVIRKVRAAETSGRQ